VRKEVQSLYGKPTEKRYPTKANSDRAVRTPKCRCVHKDEPLESVGQARRRSHPDCPTPIVNDQSNPPQVEMFDQLRQVGNSLFQGEGIFCFIRLVRESAPDMVGSNASVLVAEFRNQTPPEIGPRRIAVYHEQDGSVFGGLGFIDVMVTQPFGES